MLESDYIKLNAPVMVGLLNGNIKTGELIEFDPASEFVSFTTIQISPTGKKKPVKAAMKKGVVAIVGFRRTDQSPTTPDKAATKQYDIHLTGRRSYHVSVDPDKIMDPVGFWGWPVASNDLCSVYFFFANAVTLREDKEPLGSLLVKSGVIETPDVEQGLDQQFSNKNAALGQILVEQKVVPAERVDQAAKNQTQKAKHGRFMRLGEVLIEAGLATGEDIGNALAEQKKRKGKRLGEVLVDLGIVTEADVARALAKKFHLPFVDLDDVSLDAEAIDEIPLNIIEKHRVFPYQSDPAHIYIAIADPLAMEPLDMLRFSIPKQICESMVKPSQLDKYISTYIETDGISGDKENMDSILAELHEGHEEERITSVDAVSDFGEEGEDDSAVTKFVNHCIMDAYRKGASDIHVEPYGTSSDMIIRFRVDGVCSVYQSIPFGMRNQVVARIKIMAELDITERRVPQDGKIRFMMGKKLIELRVATIPTVNGNEDVVMRILAGAGAMPITDMSFSDENLENLKSIITRPYGLILCVGPTGSGKTTTLHAMVGHINDDVRKIWTAEDPVEITQYGLRQVQVKPKIGFTFASAMRAFLRADPDVILVGEMRDKETASIGVEASLTGHLVVSTLHTNSAAETITRLIDMGLDPFSFADALLGVLAQRLVRRLCTGCKESYEGKQSDFDELAHFYGEERLTDRLGGKDLTLWRGTGCEKCDNTGYKGRVGVHELLVASDDLREAVQHKATVDEIVTLARKEGMKTLLEDGLNKSIEGITDLRQVLSVCSR